MIGWTEIRPLLIEVFTECARHPGFLAEAFAASFAERGRGMDHPEQRASVLLRVMSCVGVGEDETRGEMVGDDLIETVSGQRTVTLQVQVRCPVADDERHAMAMIERIRTRLARRRVIQRLLDAEIAIQRCGASVTLPNFKDRGHVVDVANMDVMLGMVASEDDPIPVGWVQYIVLSSHLKEGTELQPALQLVNAEVPTIP